MKRGLVTENHVVVYCDGCGDLYTDAAGEAVCFTSTNQAAYYLAGGHNGWLYDGDRITCDGCVISAVCDLHGHDFDMPAESVTADSVSTLARCLRCGAPDDEQENLK